MQNQILRYPVQHPLLKKYIKFFWALRIDQAQLNHKLIPQRNINIRFNLSSTPHYAYRGNEANRLENVYFLGLRDRSADAFLKLNGDVDVLGICFEPDGVYPFLKMPVSEFKNQILGADEIGFYPSARISERLKETQGIAERLSILENELLSLLTAPDHDLEKFRLLFNGLKHENSLSLNGFCNLHNINIRQLERMYAKYVGLPASTYSTLNRFHGSLNQMLNGAYTKLSDLAYDQNYFDQMHFIKEFKRFTGNTPREFILHNNSILQIGKMV